MLLVFVVGAGSLGWMLVLGAVMSVEKNVSWGRKIGAPLGVVLVESGLMLGVAPALQSPDETVAKVALVPDDGSDVSGTATFADGAGGVEVGLDVRGLPDPGEIYLAHVHPGSCKERAHGGAEGHDHHGAAAGEIEHALTRISPDSRGDGSSATVIGDATVTGLFAGRESYVNVHAEAPSSEGLPQSVSCGDLRGSG